VRSRAKIRAKSNAREGEADKDECSYTEAPKEDDLNSTVETSDDQRKITYLPVTSHILATMMTITRSDLISAATQDKSTSLLSFLLSSSMRLDHQGGHHLPMGDHAKKSAFSQLSIRRRVLALLLFLSSSMRLEHSVELLAAKGLISTKHRLLLVYNAQS
jgi:hypothetical protein